MLASNDFITTAHQGVSASSVAVLLDKLITKGASPCGLPTEKRAALTIPQLTRFDSSSIPQISVYDYLERLKKFVRCDTTVVIALIYVDRLLAADSNFTLTQRNVHRLLLTCLTVAEKYIVDTPYYNSCYATVGGVSLEELNSLEVGLAYALRWRLGVSQEEYHKKQEELSCAFADLLSSSEATEWIVLKEAVCETKCEAICEKQRRSSESSMQASTISGSESSSDSVETDSESETDSAPELPFNTAPYDPTVDSSSEVDEEDESIFVN